MPQNNWSLDDLFQIIVKLKRNDVFGVSFEPEIYWALPYLSYYGEEFNKNFDVEKSLGIKFYKELRDKYKTAPSKSQVGSSTLAQMFLDGKIALYLSGRWMYPIISEKANFNWAVINFPYGEGLQPCDASGWAIAKSSKNKKAALKFVEYLTNENSSKYFAQTGLVVPARIKASKLLDNKEHNERVFLEVIKYSKTYPVTKNYKKLVDEFNVINFN
jgi:multiple sugar transport system substrate-binding protein